MIKLKKLINPAQAREVADDEREDLLIYLVNRAQLSAVEICRTVMQPGITVFDNYFAKQTGLDGRLMMVRLPDGKLHSFAWTRGGLPRVLFELTYEAFERYSAF